MLGNEMRKLIEAIDPNSSNNPGILDDPEVQKAITTWADQKALELVDDQMSVLEVDLEEKFEGLDSDVIEDHVIAIEKAMLMAVHNRLKETIKSYDMI